MVNGFSVCPQLTTRFDGRKIILGLTLKMRIACHS
jgi:hypothetical protein